LPQENKLRSKKHRTSGGWRAKGNDKTAKLVIQGGCQRGKFDAPVGGGGWKKDYHSCDRY